MAIHTYRPALPDDTAIRACTTITTFTNLLGPPQVQDGAPFTASWDFFTLTSTNTIEALSVFTSRNDINSPIDSLEIRRGIARADQ